MPYMTSYPLHTHDTLTHFTLATLSSLHTLIPWHTDTILLCILIISDIIDTLLYFTFHFFTSHHIYHDIMTPCPLWHHNPITMFPCHTWHHDIITHYNPSIPLHFVTLTPLHSQIPLYTDTITIHTLTSYDITDTLLYKSPCFLTPLTLKPISLHNLPSLP